MRAFLQAVALGLFLTVPLWDSVASPKKKEWTVMVYMAADNNLAIAGLDDLEEMEKAGGSSSDVQFVVQAEFSKDNLAQYGLRKPQNFQRPNYHTFRYPVVKSRNLYGPEGKVKDIGNRNMTLASELSSFIKWAKKTYPAKRYALVLWNHGGGVQGLLQDETSAGYDLMSLQTLRSALQSAGKVDLIDFDMCLMASYEVFNVLDGMTDYVVASQEVVPGAGNPYQPIFKALRRKPKMTPRALSLLIAQKYNDSYHDERSSTTISAFAMSGYGAFVSALDALAAASEAALTPIKTPMTSAAGAAQAYEFKVYKDIQDLLTRVVPLLPDDAAVSTLPTLVDSVDSALNSSNFLLTNLLHEGTSFGSRSVANSHGLSITLPALNGDDVFDTGGPGSLANYLTQVPGTQWSSFVNAYVGVGVPQDVVDLGDERPSWYLVWNSAAERNSAEVDLAIVEPDGNFYFPYLGTVTPNGTLTPDSVQSGEPFEGFSFQRFIAPGTYYLFGMLYADPNDYRPLVDVAYRTSPTASYQSLYSPNYPVLNLDYSFRNDPDASFQTLFDNTYTDFKLLATWCFGSGCPSSTHAASAAGSLGAQSLPMMTEEQKKTFAKVLHERRTLRATPRPRVHAPEAAISSGGREDLGNAYFREHVYKK